MPAMYQKPNKPQTDLALAFIHQHYDQRVHMAVAFARGQVQILHQSPEALLIMDHASGMPMLCADNEQAALLALSAMPDKDVLLIDDMGMAPAIMERLGFSGHTACINVVYEGEPHKVDSPLRLQALSVPQHAATIITHYHLHDEAEIHQMIGEERLLGCFVGQDWVGFIGWHEENSMGLLHVFEQYRRRGYAHALEALQINLILSRGEIPFGQVIVGNEASLALQRKLGFRIADRPMGWLWRG